MSNNIQKYLNQDIHNPKYLFHGSPVLLEKLIPQMSHDSNNDENNIATAIFLFPSLIKASSYAFKDTIKKTSVGLDWDFQISNKDEYPVMRMKNIRVDDDIIGYIYVVRKNDKMIKDKNSLQYKCYDELYPIDVLEIKYIDFKQYYEIIGSGYNEWKNRWIKINYNFWKIKFIFFEKR